MIKEETYKLFGWKPADGDYSVRKELGKDKKKKIINLGSSYFLKSFLYNMERLKKEVFISDKL